MTPVGGAAGGFAPMEEREGRLGVVRAIAELRHPHLVVMRRTGDGWGYVPEMSGGRSLARLRAAHGSLSLNLSLRILLDALSGLAALHQASRNGKPLAFVHGEVSPSNIIVGRDGFARLVPLVRAHWSAGGPPPPEAIGYVAPEKLLGDAFGQRADVFSAGVLLWEAMAGKSLFGDLTIDQVVTQLVGGKVSRPVPAVDAPWTAELAEVAMRALAVDPADRFEHVGIMGADIETIAQGHVGSPAVLATLVVGHESAHDSFSGELAASKSVAASLVPTSNSIPLDAEPPTVPGARRRGLSVLEGGTEVRLGEDAETHLDDIDALPIGMSRRRRRSIFVAAISVCVALLGFAGFKALERKNESTPSSTVKSPAATLPLALSSVPSVLDEPVARAPADLPTPAVRPPPPPPAPIEIETRLPRPNANAGVVAATSAAPASSHGAPAKSKVKGEDPFGLMKPVKPKVKDDPFGL